MNMRSDVRKFSGMAAIVAIAAVMVPATATACSCRQPTQARIAEFSDVVVAGTVLSVKRTPDSVRATIRVTQIFKGKPGRVIEVRTRTESAACGVNFRKGTTLRFGARREGYAFTTNLCSLF